MKVRFFFRQYWLLCLIFVIALFLRVYKLYEIPVGLHGDEASIGYNAYSLLKTARDQDGNFLPLSFDQFGNFRAAGYHYIDVPFVAFLGLTTLAVRLPAALFGALTIIVFYLLINELFKKKNIALLGSLLLAILPWHINISRASEEGVISSFFVLLGIYILYKALQRNSDSIVLFFWSFLSLFTSLFFYHASGFFVPVFLPFLFAISFLQKRPGKIKIIASICVYVALVLGLFFFLSIGKGSGRVSQVSLLNIPGGTGELKQAMDEEGNQNPLLTRFYNNKLYFYGRLFFTFYSEHLSGDFLFVNNGLPIRYKIPWTGNLYIIEAPFLFLGFAFLLTEGLKQKKYVYLLPIFWLLIGPMPAALTWEDLPNLVRSNLMIPGLLMIIAFGFYESIQLIKKRNVKLLFIIISIGILTQNYLYFYHNYFWRLKIHEPWFRSAAEQDLIFSIQNLSKNNQQFVMTTQNNNNLIFYLFYTKFDPKTFQNLGSPRERNDLHFQNLAYTYNDCPLKGDPKLDDIVKSDMNIIYVDKPQCPLPKNANVITVVRTPDGLPAFQLAQLRK